MPCSSFVEKYARVPVTFSHVSALNLAPWRSKHTCCAVVFPERRVATSSPSTDMRSRLIWYLVFLSANVVRSKYATNHIAKKKQLSKLIRNHPGNITITES